MELVTIKEASDRSGVSRQTLTKWGELGVIKMRKHGNAYWVDADTIDALADTIADVEHAKRMLKQEREETRKLYEREREIRQDLERELFHLEKDNGWYTAKKFYMSIPIMLQELGVLSKRDATIMQRMINGDDIGRIGEDFRLTRLTLIRIFEKGCIKAQYLSEVKELIENAKREHAELEYLRKKEKTDARHILKLERKLERKH